MTILKNSPKGLSVASLGCALLLWLASSALAAPGRPAPAPTLDGLVRDSRAAYFRGEYEESAQLAMEALLAEPSNDEARDLLRLSAKVLAELDVRSVQQERAKLMEGLKAIRAKQAEDKALEQDLWKKEDKELVVRLQDVEKSRPLWSAWARAYVAHGEILETYQLIYQVKDQFPNEAWVLPQLDRLSNVLKRDAAMLEKRSPEYREAVHAYAIAFEIAEAEAKRRRRSGFTLDEQERLVRAQRLLRLAMDEGATPQERQSAYRKAHKELDGLLVLPDRARAAIEHKIARAIGA